MHPLALLVLDLDLRSDGHRVVGRGALVQDHRALEPVSQHRDPTLEQALLVLCGVVLEVLRKVAEAASRRDRLDGFGPARALELCQLGFELLLLSLGQGIGLIAGAFKERSDLADKK